jgi:phosphatidylethanolamine-binding protein (PEBP) family uncharacterized protein
MNYQGIRAEFESDLHTAYSDLSPAVPVYFDNTFNTVSDADTEFIHVNLQFGLTTETTLTTQNDYIRGTIVVRAYTEKGKGPARNQTLISTAVTTLKALSDQAKASTGIYVRIGALNGPSFGTTTGATESRLALTPFFVSRIDMSFTASSSSGSGSSTPLALVLTSTDFTDGTALPVNVGSNAPTTADLTNPQLGWALTGDDSANVTEYRLSVIDTDASDYVHWNITDIASTTLAIAATDDPDANNWDGTPTIGATSGGTGAALSNGWEPCDPPPGEPHTYEFVVTGFATDGTLLVTSNTLSGTYTAS